MTTSYLAHGGSDFSRVLDTLPADAVSAPEEKVTIRGLLVDWLKGKTLALRGPEDRITQVEGEPLVKTLNFDHIPGTECRP